MGPNPDINGQRESERARETIYIYIYTYDTQRK